MGMKGSDVIKTGVGLCASYVGINWITKGAFGRWIKDATNKGKETIDKLVSNEKVVNGVVGAGAGIYTIPKIKKVVEEGPSDKLKAGLAGGALGVTGGVAYEMNKDKINKTVKDYTKPSTPEPQEAPQE